MFNIFIDARDLSGTSDEYYNGKGISLHPAKKSTTKFKCLKRALDNYECEHELPQSTSIENWNITNAGVALSDIIHNHSYNINSEDINFFTEDKAYCLCGTKITRIFAIVNKNDKLAKAGCESKKRGIAFIGSSCIHHMSEKNVKKYEDDIFKYSGRKICYVCGKQTKLKKICCKKCEPETVFNFGKYKGMSVEIVNKINSGYLKWCLNVKEPNGSLKKMQSIIKNYFKQNS